MKAISLWQPWASAIVVGAKRHETRSWPTKHRGRLAIHAAQKRGPVLRKVFHDLLEHEIVRGCLEADLELDYEELPFGALVATCRLVDCIPVEQAKPDKADAVLGDYSPGRFAWVLEDVKRLNPVVPFRGRQGLFDVPLWTERL